MGKKVLVVDESATIREFLKMYLEEAFFEVITCENGKGAILHLGVVDALITDFLLVLGFNGADLAKIAKNQRPNLPVMIMTGNPTYWIPSDHVADKVIMKPFHLDTILEWLREVTAEKTISSIQAEELRKVVGGGDFAF